MRINICNKISTGALSDLEKVTKQAMAMVTIYGLDEKIGNGSYYDSQNQGYGFTKPYSEETAMAVMAQTDISITINLQRGAVNQRVWTSDLSLDYVHINADYRT